MASDQNPEAGEPSGGQRNVLPWSGIGFAVLYVVGLIAATSSPANTDKYKNNPEGLILLWRHFYADSGNRTTIFIGTMLLLLASLMMILFGSVLRERLAAAGAAGAGRLAFAGSILFAAVTIVGAVAVFWLPGAKQFGSAPIPRGELAYLASQLGFGLLLLGGGTAAALVLVTAGWAATRTGALPTWLGWAGVIIGVLLFFLAAMFVPMLLLVLWVLIASIAMLRNPA